MENRQPVPGTLFPSRKNTVTMTASGAVSKVFADVDCFRRERDCLGRLADLHAPKLLAEEDMALTLTYIPGHTALELLEREERDCTEQPDHWLQLVDWLWIFHKTTGLCHGDPNLRNFILWDGHWYGLDFECCGEGAPETDFAALTAFLFHYRPEETAHKRRIVQKMDERFSGLSGISLPELEALRSAAEAQLLERRRLHKNREK